MAATATKKKQSPPTALQHLERALDELDAARRQADGGHGGRDLHDALLGERLEDGTGRGPGDDDLGEPFGVAQDQERDRLEQPTAVDPAGHRDGFAGVPGKIGGEDAGHSGRQPITAAPARKPPFGAILEL